MKIPKRLLKWAVFQTQILVKKKFKNPCIKILELNIEKGIPICIISDRIKYLHKN